MDSHSLIYYPFVFSLLCFASLISAQQPYADNICPPNHNTSTNLGYACNGANRTCLAYLIYRTQPPYNTLSSIASLLSANLSQVSEINDRPKNTTLPTNTEVIVPVTCSCAGRVYQANTTYLVRAGDNYYVIANNTFEGLTTCDAIRYEKLSPNIVNIFPNERLTIPLRCACPTKRQAEKGIRYLMSFVVQEGNSVADVAIKFGADVGQTLEANEKSEQEIGDIKPFTTLLLPLRSPPNGSQIMFPPPISSLPSPPPSPSLATQSLTPSGHKTKKWVYFGVGVVAGGAFVLVIIIISLFICLRTGRMKTGSSVSAQSFEAQEKALAKEPETKPIDFLKSISSMTSLKVYSFTDLQASTENFSNDNWIKGSVYMGIIDRHQVAIKKMNGDVSKEISMLNKINHFNLIRFLGVCFEDGVWYLIYEYAANGPLSQWIYQENPDRKILSWKKRMQIASDVATGLNYLHSYTTPPHVHKDINSRNILLDSNFRAKIAKFGLSRPVRGNDGQFTLTEHIVGTKGYLAPEYLENGLVSPMLDVYSFGVLLLEMLTGKDVASLYEGVKAHLSEVLAPLLDEEDGKQKLKVCVDPSLGGNYPEDMTMSMFFLVDRCLRQDPGSRPATDEIVQILSNTLTTSLIWDSASASTSSSWLYQD